MSSKAIVPAGLPKIILLPSAEADLIDEVVAGALKSETRQGASADELEREKQKHESAVSILVDSTSASHSHLWHFLDTLGKYINQSSEAGTCLRGLLLLHGFLRACSRERFQEATRMLLKVNAGSKQEDDASSSSSGKPELDLLSMSLHFHLTIAAQQQVPVNNSSAAVAAVKAYAKFLLQRIASSRFIFLPSSAAQAASISTTKGQQNQACERAVEPGLGQEHWAKQDAPGMMRQLQALQRLQEGVVSCGMACGKWLQIAQDLASSPPGSQQQRGGGSEEAGGMAASMPQWVHSSSLAMSVSLECLLKDSFLLFSSINYGLMELIERIGSIPKEEGVQALQVCRTSANQGKALSDLYMLLGSLSVGHGVSFPSVAVMGDSYLSSLEHIVGDAGGQEPGTPREALQNSMIFYDPAAQQSPASAPSQLAPPSYTQLAAAHQYEATTQALFGRYAPPPAQLPPLPGSTAAGGAQPGNQLVPYQPKAAWEEALDSALAGQPSNGVAPARSIPAQAQAQVGTDQAMAVSLYEAAEAQRRASAAAMQQQGWYQQQQQHAAHNMQVGIYGGQQKRDPFAASASVAPPSYVQMSMRAQQQMALELQRRMMSKHLQFSGSLASDWNTNGHGVHYGNVVVPF